MESDAEVKRLDKELASKRRQHKLEIQKLDEEVANHDKASLQKIKDAKALTDQKIAEIAKSTQSEVLKLEANVNSAKKAKDSILNVIQLELKNAKKTAELERQKYIKDLESRGEHC